MPKDVIVSLCGFVLAIIIAVIFVTIVFFLFSGTVATAAESQDTNGITPKAALSVGMPAKYPANVKSMTDKQFFKWATKRNAAATDAWFNEAALSPPRYKTVKVQVTKGKSSTRMTGNSGTTVNGYTTLPKRVSGSSTHETYEYTRRYMNPSYSWPGPLTIINPYVRPK